MLTDAFAAAVAKKTAPKKAPSTCVEASLSWVKEYLQQHLG